MAAAEKRERTGCLVPIRGLFQKTAIADTEQTNRNNDIKERQL